MIKKQKGQIAFELNFFGRLLCSLKNTPQKPSFSFHSIGFSSSKGQIAFEFLIIFVFIMVIVSLLIYLLGFLFFDASNQQKKIELDDVAQLLIDEFDLINSLDGGFTRTIQIPSHIVRDYNITMDESIGLITLQDIHSRVDPNNKYYYFFEGNINFTYLRDDSNPNFPQANLTIRKARLQSSQGLILN